MNAPLVSAVEARNRMPDAGFSPNSAGPRSAAAIPLRLCASAVESGFTAETLRPQRFFPKSENRNPKFELRISYLPSSVRLNAPAFSLTEVVIALGIFAVSMVGILALFPVASSTGQESSEETQAAILAQMIFDEIRDSADVRYSANAYTLAGPNTVTTTHWQAVNLTANNTYYVSYDVKRRDNSTVTTDGPGMMGDPIALKAIFNASLGSNNFTTGQAGANYLARLDVVPLGQRSRLTQLTLRIDTPGNLPATNRRSFFFTTLVSAR